MRPSGAFRSGSSGSSSDDPDIIRPVGSRFSVQVEKRKRTSKIPRSLQSAVYKMFSF